VKRWLVVVLLSAVSLGAESLGAEPPAESPIPEPPIPGSPIPESPIPESPEPDPFFYEADPEALATDEEVPARSEVEIVRARLRAETGHRAVREVRRLTSGARAEWSRQGDVFAFDRPGDLGYRALYLGTMQGSERCLTCNLASFKKAHVMAPTWHPSGDYLVAVVQDSGRNLEMDALTLTSPARSFHSELWAITRDGRDAWQLSQVNDQGGAILDATFSQEGDRLAWSERETSEPKPWGEWVLRVAEFKTSRGLPRFGKIESFRPHRGFMTLSSFSADDRGLWLSLARPGADARLSVARLNLADKALTRFPNETAQTRMALELPRSDRQLWISSRGLEGDFADLWLTSPSGQNQERLTFFNDLADVPYGLGQAFLADVSADKDGLRLLAHVVSGAKGAWVDTLYLIELDPERLPGRLP
jgi:hypothetical protein